MNIMNGSSERLKIKKRITYFVADTLEVNRSTARGIVARYLREGRIEELPRGGRSNVRVNDEMRECLEDILNENCVLTLAQINRELRGRLPAKPQIHDRTVARTLTRHVIYCQIRQTGRTLAR